jgi:hypothetical protein
MNEILAVCVFNMAPSLMPRPCRPSLRESVSWRLARLNGLDAAAAACLCAPSLTPMPVLAP